MTDTPIPALARDDDADLAEALDHVRAAAAILARRFEVLSPKARKRLTPTPGGFLTAARPTVHAARRFPALAAICDNFDADRVEADLHVAGKAADLLRSLALLEQAVGDVRQNRISRAYRQTLEIYRIAKLTPTFRMVTEPMEKMYDRRRKPRKKKEG